ncbi:MAG: DUF427 domain-containing protein [Acidimicrobiia bacterium]|nr:DUF427 domain-containing protein [Acidimicrobiia bacterium]
MEPKSGQESVWDYPRPPRLEPEKRRVRVVVGGSTIADSTAAMRVLETSHPPGIYIPPQDIVDGALQPNPLVTGCEWKGRAVYWDVEFDHVFAEAAAWSYPDPTPPFLSIANFVSFYPSRVQACYLDDELVVAQDGNFYGGWITSEIVGPFKGATGTWGW